MWKSLVITVVLELIGFVVFGQSSKASSIWYQDQLRIDFRTTPPVVTQVNEPQGGSRTSTFCDENGDVLFYTNGITVWNKLGQIMLDGDNINTSHGNYPINCVIVPHPGDHELYYIFVTNVGDSPFIDPKGLYYCVVDMSLDNGDGAVVQQGQTLIDQVPGTLTVITHAEEQSFWVISHGLNNTLFYAFKISASGIEQPIITDVGSVFDGEEFRYELKAAPDGSKLAFTNAGVGELFDFDSKTGIVSNYRTLGQIGAGGVEFSPNSELLYFCTPSLDGGVIQFDVSTGDIDVILESQIKVGEKSSTGLNDLQLGYNGKIYASYGAGQGADSIPCIQFPNVKGLGCKYTNGGLPVTPFGGIFNLPLAVQSFFRESAKIPDANGCKDVPASLRITSLGYADSIVWNFGDGPTMTYQGTSGKIVTHIYNQPGTYVVSAKKYISNLSRTIQGSVVIYEKPSVNLGADTVLCNGDVLILDAHNDGNVYQWSTGEITQTIEVKTTNTYSVTVDNGHCNNSDQVEVTFNEYPDASLGTDKVVCDGAQSVKLNVSDNAAYKFRWSTGDVVSETDVTESGQYKVQVSNGPCVSKDSVEVTFATVKAVTFQDTTLVVPFDKELTLSEAGVNASKWTWDFGDGLQQVQNSPSVTHNYDRAGKYIGSVILSNDFGCNAKIPFEVEVPYHLLIPNVFTPNGDDKNETFEIQCNGDVSNFNLIVFDRWGKEVFESKSIDKKWNAADNSSGVYFYNVQVGENKYNGWLQVIK